MGLLKSAFGMAGERAKSDSDGMDAYWIYNMKHSSHVKDKVLTDTIKIKTDFIYFLNEIVLHVLPSVQIITNLKEKKVFSYSSEWNTLFSLYKSLFRLTSQIHHL